jgi:hypothetical protein
MIAVTVLLAARIKPCGILIVLVASLAIVAIETGSGSSPSHTHVKITQNFESPRAHWS